MRSVIKQANAAGIEAVVAQQFEIGRQIVAAGLVPIIEPEVDIHCPDKAEAEKMLLERLLAELGCAGRARRSCSSSRCRRQTASIRRLRGTPAGAAGGSAVRRLQPR
jgi:hypothetical protein